LEWIKSSMAETAPPVIVLFRNDLRLSDNPALSAAVARGGPLLPVFVHDETPPLRPLGGAARWWLHHSLSRLIETITQCGAELLLLRGNTKALILTLIERTGAKHVFWNRRYGLAEIEADKDLKSALQAKGVDAKSFNGHLLHEPWDVKSKTGTHLRVFTPFYRAMTALGEPEAPLPPPQRLHAYQGTLPKDTRFTLADLQLLPTQPDWSEGLGAEWRPGEAGAAERLSVFLDGAIDGYCEDRNRPDKLSTSMLSPHLRFGEISVRQVWHAAVASFRSGKSKASPSDQETFLKELGWREFSYHLLYHHPDLASANHQPKFNDFPWQDTPEKLKAWQRGRTGYPIVDAGMRQLWQTGWMHNRVRMIVGSFLVKHLLIDWRHGEDWFWDTLVDADPASNAASWQWVAGSGADAAPYFRIFNPISQGEKFDPHGDYVRKYVPELASMPAKFIHRPWDADLVTLRAAGVKLGSTYPVAVVNHDFARQRALAAFKSISSAAA
jgi:deoxyribodipyrimidine photo-lyase